MKKHQPTEQPEQPEQPIYPMTSVTTAKILTDFEEDQNFTEDQRTIARNAIEYTMRTVLQMYDETLKELGVDCSTCKCGNDPQVGCSDMCIMMNEVVE